MRNNMQDTASVISFDWNNWEEKNIKDILPDWIISSDCFYDTKGITESFIFNLRFIIIDRF